MSTSRDVADLLRALAAAMQAGGLPWYLFGAQAAIVWGSPRLSGDVNGTVVPVISPEDLIVTKILAGRAKDLEDVRGVLAERKSSLDVTRIRAVLDLLEQALNRSDLLSVFEKEWERVK